MNEQDILDAGYREYTKTPFDNDFVDKCYQKRFDDDNGKKYFIDIKHYKPMQHPYTGDIIDCGYEYGSQLYDKDTHEPINILFFAGWNIERVEKFISDLFDSGKLDYYEEW